MHSMKPDISAENDIFNNNNHENKNFINDEESYLHYKDTQKKNFNNISLIDSETNYLQNS